MMDLQALAHEIYAVNKANGWHEGEPRSWAEICMLVDSEIAGEAVEALRDKDHDVTDIWYSGQELCDADDPATLKPEGAATEIADGVIRLLDAMIEKNIYIPASVLDGVGDKCGVVERVRDLSRLTHRIEDTDDRPYACRWFISRACDLIRSLGHDPEEVVREKLAYNRTRGYKHGGKKL